MQITVQNYGNFGTMPGCVMGRIKWHGVRAAVLGESKVITKEAGEYDYANKKLTWKIVVNQNKAEMKDIVVIDQLPKGVTLDPDPGSVQYQISKGSQSTGPEPLDAKSDAPGYSYKKENKTSKLYLYLPNMSAERIRLQLPILPLLMWMK